MDFGSILRKSCRMYRHNAAVTFGQQHQTYAQLWERACRLANALRDLGLEPGDRVAVLGNNQLETIEQAAGLALAGLVRCPMYVQNPAEVHAHCLNAVGATACLVQQDYAADVIAIRHQVPALKHLIVLGASEGADLNYEQMLAAASPEDPGVALGEDDDHIIRFSAGTTGRPKGILHSVRGWREMGNEFALVLPRMQDTDAYLVAAPLSHAAGLLMWPLIAHGCRHVIMPAFHPGRFLDLIERERCTLTFLVPTMIQMLTTEPGAGIRDLSSLRMVLYGASPINERTLRESIELWGNIMYQVYGQSEALPATVLTPQHHIVDGSEQERRYLRSAGRVTPNSALMILDDQDVEVGVGDLGEICVKSPGAMKAIWGDPEATALRLTADGYVRSRDIGYLDDRGFLYLADRKEDMIISGGFNVWPAEVENALASHPAVQEVAVVGVPDQKWGEAVLAVVVLRDQQQATEQELIDWARQKVGRIKKPARIEFSTEPLPKSPVGKMIRRLVRERIGSTSQHIHGA